MYLIKIKFSEAKVFTDIEVSKNIEIQFAANKAIF